MVLASLYSLYLVIHPYTPMSVLSISVLDITQVQRATHVFLLLAGGYLISSCRDRKGSRAGTGAYSFAVMSVIPLYSFWELGQSTTQNLAAALFWLVAVVPTLYPPSGKVMDRLGALLALLPFLYQVILFQDIIERAMLPEPWDLVMGFGLTMLLLGQVYRYTGPILPCLVLTFLLYNLYGGTFSGPLSHAGFDFDLLLGKLYSETEAGLFGLITGVSMKYLVYFTILGGVVSVLNLGKVIANIASLASGNRADAPGIVTALASVFMGMFSGSGAADTQFVSTISKPMYEKAGYDTYTSAGICATAGTIAMITPPVLGSMAFVMVEILSIPYSWVCVMALAPMAIYLTAILTYNYFYVKMMGLKPAEAADRVKAGYFRRYSYIFVPILVIVAFIYLGYAVSLAVVAAIFLFILFAYLDPTIRPKQLSIIWKGLADGFSSLIPIGTAVVCANLILTLMVLTGLPNKFSQLLTMISGSSLLVATGFAATFSLLLGMGIPPTATYVVSSSLTAPAILQIAMANGIPQDNALLATHMFLMYYAILADVTPPVALSAYASASVFLTDPLRTGVYAAKVALPKYLLGFSFILAPQGVALLLIPIWDDMPWYEALGQFTLRLSIVLAGAGVMAAATVGYARRTLAMWERWTLGTASVLLFLPFLWLNAAALAVAAWFFLGKKSKSPMGAAAS
jgi:TRAP transporter 4TM/12TM fusion protein